VGCLPLPALALGPGVRPWRRPPGPVRPAHPYLWAHGLTGLPTRPWCCSSIRPKIPRRGCYHLLQEQGSIGSAVSGDGPHVMANSPSFSVSSRNSTPTSLQLPGRGNRLCGSIAGVGRFHFALMGRLRQHRRKARTRIFDHWWWSAFGAIGSSSRLVNMLHDICLRPRDGIPLAPGMQLWPFRQMFWSTFHRPRGSAPRCLRRKPLQQGGAGERPDLASSYGASLAPGRSASQR